MIKNFAHYNLYIDFCSRFLKEYVSVMFIASNLVLYFT